MMAIKEGWTGRVFEDFEVGDIYRHALGRTVLATDNIWFTLLTMNTNPIHFDHAYAAKTEFGKPSVDSTFTLARGDRPIGRRHFSKRDGQSGLGRSAPARIRSSRATRFIRRAKFSRSANRNPGRTWASCVSRPRASHRMEPWSSNSSAPS